MPCQILIRFLNDSKCVLSPFMRIIINPRYAHLREYLEHINEHFDHEGHEIHRDRNVIRTLQVDGLTLCVKRYGRASLPARVATRLRVKASRARKAYVSPLLLKERGFESPEPVAFVRYNKGLLDSVSYFVCLKSSYRYSMADIMKLDETRRREVTEAFAKYSAHLHQNGFLHRDFSADNILFDFVTDRLSTRIHFSLIDTNSMRCGRSVGLKRGCTNFARLIGDDSFFRYLAACYAKEREADAEECTTLILKARDEYRQRTEK